MANSPRINASVSSVMAKGGSPSGASASASTTTIRNGRSAAGTDSGLLA